MNPELRIFHPSSQHQEWLERQDCHVDGMWIARCIEHKEYLVGALDERVIGFLRFSWFWGRVPYMEIIKVVESDRRLGIGTKLLNHWEGLMREKGASVLMTSAMSDEPAPQAWHRHNGFFDSGHLTFGSFQQTPEAFLIKRL